nr:two-component regulator propeller domain-containing protein [Massilia sp. Se16.2.3]
MRAIAADRSGQLWLATRTGLVRFDPASKRVELLRHRETDPSSLASDEVYALAFDAAGGLWAGTAAGVDYLAPGSRRLAHFPVEASAQADPQRKQVRALAFDAATLWVGTARGLEAWKAGGGQPRARRHFGAKEGIGQGAVTTLYRDGQGRLWAGTQNEGLKRWDEATGRFDGFAHAAGNPATLADDHVSSLYQDRSGSLWVGTWFAGISRVDLRGSGFAHVAAAQPGAPGSLSSNKITGILGDGVDGLWLSTYGGGLNRLDLRDGSVRVVRHRAGVPSSLNDDLVSCLARDRTGQLWVGTRSGGFGRFDPASGRFTARALGGGGADFVQAIVPDRENILWIATRGGPVPLRPGDRRAAQLPSRSVRPGQPGRRLRLERAGRPRRQALGRHLERPGPAGSGQRPLQSRAPRSARSRKPQPQPDLLPAGSARRHAVGGHRRRAEPVDAGRLRHAELPGGRRTRGAWTTPPSTPCWKTGRGTCGSAPVPASATSTRAAGAFATTRRATAWPRATILSALPISRRMAACISAASTAA